MSGSFLKQRFLEALPPRFVFWDGEVWWSSAACGKIVIDAWTLISQAPERQRANILRFARCLEQHGQSTAAVSLARITVLSAKLAMMQLRCAHPTAIQPAGSYDIPLHSGRRVLYGNSLTGALPESWTAMGSLQRL